MGLHEGKASTVGFFFLGTNNSHTRIGAFQQALRDVAWQISRLDTKYADHVASQCRSVEDIETLPSAWRKLFVGYFGAASRSTLYLVIDGLDEVEEDGEYGRAEFLNLLSAFQGACYFMYDLSHRVTQHRHRNLAACPFVQ
jgi:hypothetical protein